ncbi:flagellar hook-length control protein FliK [Paraglaciecola sp. 2405UD69-4]|uniref:flagellar hook-length control protein FliK n=1 Tax=Paraglaciecola sp. 2405UD69-4 TaxID=3391836 RepID=UPI0039C92982
MMQQVATTKSELAAFASGAETSSQLESNTKEQFGLLLKGHQNDHGYSNSARSAFDNARERADATPDKQKKVSTDLSNSKASKTASVLDENTHVTKDEFENSQKTKQTSSGEAVESTKVELEGHSDAKALKSGEHDVLPRDFDIESEVNGESKSDAESDIINVDQWVDLVGNLQGLGRDSLVQSDGKKLDKQVNDENVAVSMLSTSNTEEIDATNSSTDIAINQEDTSELVDIGRGEVSEHFVNQKLISKILSEVEQAPRDKEISKIVSEMLDTLTQDDEGVSDDLVIATETSLDLSKNLNDKIDAEHTVADLTKEVNKALFVDLLQETEELNLDDLAADDLMTTESLTPKAEISQVTTAIETSVAETIDVASTTDGAEQPFVADIIDSETDLADTAAIPVINTASLPVETKQSDVKKLLDLPSSKLNKVLENISHRVIDTSQGNSVDLTEQSQATAQQVASSLTADFPVGGELASKEFVAALKTGLQEFKEQLSKGREPGIDLKALIAEATTKVTDQSVVNKAAISADTTVNSVSQVIDFASSLSQALEHNQNQSFNSYAREVAQIQGEQSKQVQLSQVETKLDKAINITKPEGHQQLAEKVRWMVNTKNLVADIRLDPAELGSVHVKVAMSGDSATVNFVVQSHHARDAVDSATPRLREMLADKGIELGQSSVRQDSDNQQQEQGEFAGNGSSADNKTEEVEVPENIISQQKIVNGALGGVDYFV